MTFQELPLGGSFLIEPKVIGDSRGWFSRIFCKEEFSRLPKEINWVQLNSSFTNRSGTVRGMHFQRPPKSEIKLVRCVSGAIFDVIIDLRRESPTFLKWYGTILSAENHNMMLVPERFAHGFQTLADNCEVFYAHSEYYSKDHEGAIKYNDQRVGIQWPMTPTQVSDRDLSHPLLETDFAGLNILK